MNLKGRRAMFVRTVIVLYIIFLGILASIVGPASAILLLPRTIVS